MKLGTLLVDIAYSAFEKVRNRPKAVARRAAKAAKNPLDEVAEDFNQFDDGDVTMEKLKALLAKIAALRTSTKGGAIGLLAPLVVALPFYDSINSFVLQACQSEDGPLVFLAGAAITWVSFYVTARAAKTPANPGKL